MASLARDFDSHLLNRFILVSESLVRLFQQESLTLRPYLPGTPYFLNLSLAKKTDVVTHLEFYRDLCQSQVAAGESLRHNKQLTWRALSALGLKPSSDLFNHIEDGDILEIYTRDHFQIFRNLNFFDVCTYSLEELFCLEWWKLFSREQSIINSLMDIANHLLSDSCHQGFKPDVQAHVLTEILTPEKCQIEYMMLYCAPLFKNRRNEAFICIERARVVEPLKQDLGLTPSP